MILQWPEVLQKFNNIRLCLLVVNYANCINIRSDFAFSKMKILRSNRVVFLKLLLIASVVTLALHLLRPTNHITQKHVTDEKLPLKHDHNYRVMVNTDHIGSRYHNYDDQVDCRIIVMTFNRSESLKLCLTSHWIYGLTDRKGRTRLTRTR
jgi:hypothetical protein